MKGEKTEKYFITTSQSNDTYIQVHTEEKMKTHIYPFSTAYLIRMNNREFF